MKTKNYKTRAYPCRGTLYRRINGRYVNADAANAGPLFFKCRKPDGTDFFRGLNTNDRHEAVLLANGIVLALEKGCDHGAEVRETRIEEVWDQYEEDALSMSDASLDDYRQIFRRWAKRMPGKVDFAEDVTAEMCRNYAIEVAAHKTTGLRDVRVLRSIWNTVFPSRDNPWNIGIKPRVKLRESGNKSRMLTPDEARRFREVILREAREGNRSSVLTRPLLLELYDAVAFAWYYGMRVGSLCSLNWKDFNLAEQWFLHVPPKTAKWRVDPLELPILPEIAEILRRRKTDSAGDWVFPHLHAQYNKRGKAAEREHGYEMRRSANRTGQYELARDVKKLFTMAGIENDFHGRASMHGFRKSCANNLARVPNISPYLIRSILGWAGDGAGMENRYIMGQSVQEKRDALTKAIPPLGPDNTMKGDTLL